MLKVALGRVGEIKRKRETLKWQITWVESENRETGENRQNAEAWQNKKV